MAEENTEVQQVNSMDQQLNNIADNAVEDWDKKPAKSKNLVKKSKNTNKKPEKSDFDFLKSVNDYLESVPKRVNNAFENAIGDGNKIAQSKVDIICAWLAWRINVSVESMRQSVLRGLYGMYKSTVTGQVMKCANMITRFVRNPLGTLASFASTIFAPVSSVTSWLPNLIKQLVRLAENLANIASSLPPSPPSPHLNYDKFKLKIKSISLSDITSDPSNLPAPETMFPEPEKPFSDKTFANTFEKSSAKLKSNRVKFNLKSKDKKALEDLSMKYV